MAINKENVKKVMFLHLHKYLCAIKAINAIPTQSFEKADTLSECLN